LKNPFYAGAYAYGKSRKRTALIEGRARTTYKHRKPFDQWGVSSKNTTKASSSGASSNAIKSWLAANAYGKADGVKSGRGGRSLLPGLLSSVMSAGIASAVSGSDAVLNELLCEKLPASTIRCGTANGARP
jgi:hypothetical protein